MKKNSLEWKKFGDFVSADIFAVETEYSSHIIDIRVFPKHPKIWCQIAWAEDDNRRIFNEKRDVTMMPLGL